MACTVAQIEDDGLNEPDEDFTLTATVTAGTTANGTAVGTGTIVDNDAVPTLTVDDVTVNEAAGTATFTVSLSAASGQAVTVDWQTGDGSATAGADYAQQAATTLTFAPGVTSQQVVVSIHDDTVYEGSEDFDPQVLPGTCADHRAASSSAR